MKSRVSLGYDKYKGQLYMKKQVKLYITRHGETEYNKEYRAQGWSDSPLTKEGRDIAAKLGQGLKGIKFDMVYSSSSKRAMDTAQIIMDNMGINLPLHRDPDLRERGLGKLEGQVLGAGPWYKANEVAEAAGQKGKLDLDALDYHYENIDLHTKVEVEKPYELENFDEFKKRLKKGADNIIAKAPDGESNILIVSHGMAILGMIYAITGDKYAPTFIENASVTLIENIDGVYYISKVNDKSYIEG
ncbi:MAG: histidine phosphatase family protein [Defluviitaleaceae bacterium]|nr:histidine phosphatase family protein [Defluviitaleaceae bacterium]